MGLNAAPDTLEKFIQEIEKILNREGIESPTAFLNDIAGNAFLVNVDFFTAPIAIKEFNAIKQEINLEILKLMEQLELEIAGMSTDVKIIASPKNVRL